MNSKPWFVKFMKSAACFILLLMLLANLIVGIEGNKQGVKSVDGVIDLTSWDFIKDGNVDLNGEWRFYFQNVGDSIINVPGAWNLQEYPVEGYGTYNIKIKTKGIREALALKLNYIASSYELYIDGKLVYTCGKVGQSKESTIPKWAVKTVYFIPQNDITDIKIIAANYHYGRGGLTAPLIIGTPDKINEKTSMHLIIEVSLFSAIFIIGVLFIAIYFFGSRLTTHLYLGIISLIISLRPLLYGEAFFLMLFPDINWEVFNKIFVINFGVGQFFVLFAYSLYPKFMSKRIVTANIILHNTVIAAGIFLSSRWMLYILFILEVIFLLNILYIIFILIKAVRRNQDKAGIVLLSVLFLAAAASIDMINNSHLINLRYYYTPAGLLLFTVIEFMVTAHRYKESVIMNDRLKDEVDIRNMKLEMEKKQRRISEQLIRVAYDITSTLDLNEVLTRLLSHLYEIVPFSAAYIILKENERLKVAASKISEGYEWDFEDEEYMEAENECAMSSILNDKRLITSEIMKCGEVYAVRSFPLKYNNEHIGTFDVYIDKKGKELFNESNLIEVFADQAAIAIQNARLYSEIREYANVDALTEVYTRRYFKELVEAIIDDFNTEGKYGSVIMIDIDYFKKINDRYGHIIGDFVLREVAAKCKRVIPEDAIIARYGGEEFIIFLPCSDKERVLDIIEKCRSEIEARPIYVKKHMIFVTISAGVTFQGTADYRLDKLISRADRALYQAKSEGRNRVCV